MDTSTIAALSERVQGSKHVTIRFNTTFCFTPHARHSPLKGYGISSLAFFCIYTHQLYA